MEPAYARDYKNLYERHWWWRAREELVLETLSGLRPGGNWGRILDVGCGDGLFFEKLCALGDVEGVEMDATGMDPTGPWAGRIRVQPFDERFQPGRRYDLIVMLDVLEHFPDSGAALRRAIDLLEPEGRILITVPAFRSLWTSHDELNRHHTRFTRRELVEVAEGSGGLVKSCRYIFQWTAPLKLAQHFKEKLLPADPRVPSLPPDWINRLFRGLSRAERRFFSAVSPPFGSSLLAVVARR